MASLSSLKGAAVELPLRSIGNCRLPCPMDQAGQQRRFWLDRNPYAAIRGASPRAPEFLRSRTRLSSNPRTSLRISSVCSPRRGERATSVGLSESLIGLPTVRYLPRVG